MSTLVVPHWEEISMDAERYSCAGPGELVGCWIDAANVAGNCGVCERSGNSAGSLVHRSCSNCAGKPAELKD